MFNSHFLLLIALITTTVTTTSFAGMSFEQKQRKVALLFKLQAHAPALAFEAYQRELDYEEQGMSVNSRARNETNILVDTIRKQVAKAYKAALEKKINSDMAREEIKLNIERDLGLAAPELKHELLTLAYLTLDSIDTGRTIKKVRLTNIENAMKREVIKRKEFLNHEEFGINTARFYSNIPLDQIENISNDSEQVNYKTTSELMASLVSDRKNDPVVNSSGQTIKTAQIIKADANISLKVKFEFLGASLEAGPLISFKRQYTTNAEIVAEGLSSILMSDGTFDYWKRDSSGNIFKLNGADTKRSIAFTCSADLVFTTDYVGTGSFKYMGVGSSASITNEFVNTVNLRSRRVSLPETIANKSITLQYISEICHNDFLNAKFDNTTSISASLNVMMRNVVAGLTFSHPQTNCAVDNQCYNWFNNEVISLLKMKNFPRCIEENFREKFRACNLRGLEGQNCPVYESNKLTSSGEFEFVCDVGLQCVKYEDQTFFLGVDWSHSKGRCQVIDGHNYRTPFTMVH